MQEYSRKFFHKNFFSGREILWSALLECIKENPLTGLGLNIIPSDVINNTTLSSHNLFLQIGIQMGIIGIVSIFMIFKNIIKLCSKSENNISILISCFCLGIILIEFFEVTITQNLLISGIEKWFILGYGCKEAYNSIRQNYEQI